MVDLQSKRWKAEIARQVIGMANRDPARAAAQAEGYGYLALGVIPGEVIGVKRIDLAELDEGVASYLGGSDGPGWTPSFVDIDDAAVLVVTVPPPRPGDPIWFFQKEFSGKEEGYSFTYRDGDIFVRRGSKTERANGAELRMLRARLLQGSNVVIERRRLEAANWPRLFPSPPPTWTAGQGIYAGEASSSVLPVKNAGPGVALNVSGSLDFTNQDGPIVRFVPTTIGPGDTVDLQLDWPNPPSDPAPRGLPKVWSPKRLVTDWKNVPGRFLCQDVDGGHWLTTFSIETQGARNYRHIWTRDTELVQRSDGKTLTPPESLDRESWYTSSG